MGHCEEFLTKNIEVMLVTDKCFLLSHAKIISAWLENSTKAVKEHTQFSYTEKEGSTLCEVTYNKGAIGTLLTVVFHAAENYGYQRAKENTSVALSAQF